MYNDGQMSEIDKRIMKQGLVGQMSEIDKRIMKQELVGQMSEIDRLTMNQGLACQMSERWTERQGLVGQIDPIEKYIQKFEEPNKYNNLIQNLHPTPKEDPFKKLTELKNMHDAGLITEEEYSKKKAYLLSRM